MESLPTTPPAIVQQADQVGETIQRLQSLIERYAAELKRLKNDKKLLTEQEKSILDNDSQLSIVQESAETLNKQVKMRKAELKNTIEMVNLKAKKSELSEEQKEIEETMSNHLLNYYKLTGSKSFDTSNGEQVEFKTKATISSKQLSLF
jgi:ABC-type transporter Mla subunit MlaD